MEDFIYNQLLDQLPKDSPFKICRLCVKETYGLLEIADITDFSVVYTNITNVQVIIYLRQANTSKTMNIFYTASKWSGTSKSRLPRMHASLTTI